MANTMAPLLNDVYKAVGTVAREAVGFIKAVDTRFSPEELKVGAGETQYITVPIAPVQAEADFTASMSLPTGTDRVATSVQIPISLSKKSSWNLTGEQMSALQNSGGVMQDFQMQSVKQAVRTLTNAMETRVGADIYKSASRAIGTAGTTPFASNFNEVAQLLQVFTDNGTPNDGNRFIVLNSDAAVNLRNNAVLTQANTAGSTDPLRQGSLLSIHGFDFFESNGIASHTKGTGANYLLNDGSSAVKDTSIAVDTGTGTNLAGDVIAFDSDTDNKYVVNTALSGGTLAIGKPGLRVAGTDDDPVTVGNSYTANIALHKSAYLLATRVPMMVANPAITQYVISDPVSGLSFLMLEIAGYGETTFELHIAYGYKAVYPENIATLLG